MIFMGMPSFNNLETENYASIRTVSLAPEAISNNKFYLGQKLLAGLTDFQDFIYSNPESSANFFNASKLNNLAQSFMDFVKFSVKFFSDISNKASANF